MGILLLGVVRLSERRAAFVSAVTHELRTPLTTFRLYADLLGSPAAVPKEKHQRYVETLKVEAERLHYLIENVLDWSRLERSATALQQQTLHWTEVAERLLPSLRERAAQAGMTLEVDNASLSEITFLGNQTAVERIFFNLIDNACKYARTATDRRIHIERGITQAKQITLVVRDHGPGISGEMRSQLFQPFSKSAQQAARTAPGIGLGLSLSRRLARDMGGDLVLEQSSAAGTAFAIHLPK